MAHLSPSAIFSPSVARQQLATAKDWNFIDGWLNTKFGGKSAPPFERNNDTLKALLALAALNETADEDYDLLSKVETKSLQEIQRKDATDADVKLLTALEDNLTREGHASFDALSLAAVALKQPYTGTDRLAQKIFALQAMSFNMEQASDRVAVLENHLRNELTTITTLVEEMRGDVYQLSPELPKQTLDHQCRIKVLMAKVPDLKNRIASLTATAAGSSTPSIKDVRAYEEKFNGLVATVKELEAQIKNYHGLPHDTDLARLEVEGLRVELKTLTKQRDSIFEGLVERESPRKFKS